MKRLLIPLFALGMLLSACGGGTADDGTGPIKIGYIGPLTGDAAPYGVDTRNGMMLKVNEINEAGGINGRMIEVIAEDSRCTGTDAASAAQKLVNVDKVVAIVGGQCSGETLGAAPIVDAAGVVMLSPVSSSPDVTEAGDFVFRDYPSDALKTKAMANYFVDQEYTKVAIITENTDFAVAFRDSLVGNVGEDSMVFNENVDVGTKDFRTLMARLKDVDFDIFVANGQTTATIAPMLQHMRELGITQPAISHDVGEDKSLLELAPDAAEGLFTINVPKIGDDTEFGQMMISEHGGAQAAIAFAGHAYDAMGVLAEAIADVGTAGTAIRDYLYDLDGYDGVIGTFSFDDNGDVEGINYVLSNVKDGEFVMVKDIPVN